jgi:hypothetical protein
MPDSSFKTRWAISAAVVLFSLGAQMYSWLGLGRTVTHMVMAR